MTFLNPLYLIGLSFTAVPIIIHLWFRKKLEKIPFSTLDFLKKSEARRFGWLKLREIVVLALRCMLIAFIFLSLARPQIKSDFLKPGHLASVVLIVDNSYSMAYGDNFHLAQDNIKTLLARYSSKSEFAVLGLCKSDNTSYLNQTPWIRKGKVIEHVHQISLTNKSGTIQALTSDLNIDQAKHSVEYMYIGDGQEIVFTDYPMGSFVDQAFRKSPFAGYLSAGDFLFLDEAVYQFFIYVQIFGNFLGVHHFLLHGVKLPPVL